VQQQGERLSAVTLAVRADGLLCLGGMTTLYQQFGGLPLKGRYGRMHFVPKFILSHITPRS
jgi:hypothetical protein